MSYQRARLLKENTELHELIHRLEAKVEVLGAMKTEYVAQQGKVSDADARIRQLEEETRRLEKENSSLASALADEKDTVRAPYLFSCLCAGRLWMNADEIPPKAVHAERPVVAKRKGEQSPFLV